MMWVYIIFCFLSLVFAVAITSKKEKTTEPIKEDKKTYGKRSNKKYWGKVVEVESWSWTDVFYWIEEIDEEGDVIVRKPEEFWKKENPNRKVDYQVIIRNIE